MDARDLLRRYLEQRRELGESELVLDSLHVEDVMRLLGAAGRAGPTVESRRSVRELAGEPAGDWRSSLRDAGVNVEPRVAATDPFVVPNPAALPPPAEITSEMPFKKGIV
ncbi:MAG TPA: hypothetical protein VD771_02390, partial [Gemmatimonadaceae bacterium]|nr:hypothetical protein [Gemmatimonadaceae bacterium]